MIARMRVSSSTAKAADARIGQTIHGDIPMKRAYLVMALSVALLTACSGGQPSAIFQPGEAQPGGVIPHVVQGGSGSQWASVNYGGCLQNLITGPLNSIWFGDACNNKTVRIDMSGKVHTFPVSTSVVAAGSDGNIWGIGPNNTISRMTLSGTATSFSVPCIGSPAFMWRIKPGADGNLYAAVQRQATIVRITTSGVVTCIAISRQISDDIAAGSDGNTWFTEPEAPSLLGKITPSGTLTEYPDPDSCGNPRGGGRRISLLRLLPRHRPHLDCEFE
jgi:hypothetical protein